MTKTEKGEETMSRKLRKKILGDSLIWVIIAAFVVIMLFPFVYILSTAFGKILPTLVARSVSDFNAVEIGRAHV